MLRIFYRSVNSLFRPAVITGLVFSIFAIIIAIAGTIGDGVAASYIALETGCINTQTGDSYGTDEGKNQAAVCYYYDFYGWFDSQCVCADDDHCYNYDLASGDDCGSILTTYESLLSASTAFLAILVVLSFVYSIFTCIACGGCTSSAAPPPPPPAAAPPAPVVVQMAPNPGAMPAYPQQQQQYAPVPVVAGYAPAPAPQPVVVGYAPHSQPVAYTAVVTSEAPKESI